ncbi:MHYT domain-containing protein [Rudaea sp.]|uniref:MHYT domain-containing protein n=1 Tax=Rudaea sp. TaxID=2136325 RepID=UPI002ED10B96
MSAIHSEYNYALVAMSYVLSALGSYTGLQLAMSIPSARTNVQRWFSLLGSGAALGGGAIWAMHFIAMIGCVMDMLVSYAPGLTLLSALLAIAACTLGLAITSSGEFSFARLTLGGVVMGTGVAMMHYMGMAAMLMEAHLAYDTTLVAASVTVAVVASIAALWLAFNVRGWLQMFASALVMGVAVCGMHYTGMAATTFVHDSQRHADVASGMQGDSLGSTVFVVSLILLGAMFAIGTLRQRQRQQIEI